MNKPASHGRLVRIPSRLFDEPGVPASDKAMRAAAALMKASQRLTEISKSKPPRHTNDHHRAQIERWVSSLGAVRELFAADIGSLPSAYEELEALTLCLSEVKAGRLPDSLKPRSSETGGGTQVNELGLTRRIMCAAALDVIKGEERAAGRENFTLGMAAKRVEDALRKAGVPLAHFGIGMAPDETGVSRGSQSFATAIQIKDTWRSEAQKKSADELAAFTALGEKLGSDELLLRATAGKTRWADISQCTDAIDVFADASLVRNAEGERP